MNYFITDNKFGYVKIISAKKGAFGSIPEMREKNIYPNLKEYTKHKNRFLNERYKNDS